MLKKWDDLPEFMRTEEVLPYYEYLKNKRVSLWGKRIFDIIMSLILLIIVSPVFLILAIVIAADSNGGVFFRQERITQHGKKFRIFKFRTMVANAEKLGTQVTVGNDMRVTKIGSFLRKYRLDELPQLINILLGDMSFVGTRPEVTKYVEKYTPEMYATLLLPAGVTSEASIMYKDEAKLLENADDIEKVYIEQVLPRKMYYNLKDIKKFGFFRELKIMAKTAIYVLK